MSQIEEFHRRILSAMDRISVGIEALEAGASADESQGLELSEALQEERLANAQLEERLKTLRDRHTAEIEALRGELSGGEMAEVLRSELAEARAALEAVEDVAPLKSEIAALKSELANSERVAELSAELEMLRAERISHGEAMARLDGDLRRLRKSNDELRDMVAKLKAAAEAGLTDHELLNEAAETELEALRAVRATDAAEARAVLARLEPLLASANLAEGEVE